jgi:hypothetical protein
MLFNLIHRILIQVLLSYSILIATKASFGEVPRTNVARKFVCVCANHD